MPTCHGGWVPRTWIRGDRITPIEKPFIQAIWKGNNPILIGDLLIMVIKHLLNWDDPPSRAYPKHPQPQMIQELRIINCLGYVLLGCPRKLVNG